MAASKSASLFNGKFRYFAKILPKIDACSWYLTQKFFRVSLKVIFKTDHFAITETVHPSAFKALLSFAQ